MEPNNTKPDNQDKNRPQTDNATGRGFKTRIYRNNINPTAAPTSNVYRAPQQSSPRPNNRPAGFTSSDLFQNEFDRGRQFNDCVKSL